MNLKNIQEISEDFKGQNGKTVLLRCDLNITEEDNTRILILKPTINFLLLPFLFATENQNKNVKNHILKIQMHDFCEIH